MQDFLVDINKLVELENGKDVKVLVEKEELHLMEVYRLFDRVQQDINHFVVHIYLRVQKEWVQQDSNFEGVTFDTDDKQLHEFLMSDFFFLCF